MRAFAYAARFMIRERVRSGAMTASLSASRHHRQRAPRGLACAQNPNLTPMYERSSAVDVSRTYGHAVAPDGLHPASVVRIDRAINTTIRFEAVQDCIPPWHMSSVRAPCKHEHMGVWARGLTEVLGVK